MIKASKRSIMIALTAVIILWILFWSFNLIYRYSGKSDSASFVTTENTKLIVEANISDIFISPSKNNTLTIDSLRAGGLETEISDDTISVKQNDRRFFANGFITIEVPNGIDTLIISTNIGDIDIASIAIGSGEFSTNTGDIKITDLKSEELNLKSSIGNIAITSSNINTLLDLKTATGNIEVENVNALEVNSDLETGNFWVLGTAFLSMNVKNTTGNIDICLNSQDCNIEYDIGNLSTIYIFDREQESKSGAISLGSGEPKLKLSNTIGEIAIYN